MEDQIEQTQIEAEFQQAADWLAAHTTAVNHTDLLELYGLYKQSTTGPCKAQKPTFWDLQGKAKWHAWSKLGNMPLEDAMHAYVQRLHAVQPGWECQQTKEEGSKRKSGMGPVFSTLATATGEDEPGVDGLQGPGADNSRLHALAGAGDVQGVQTCLDAGTDIDQRDDQGCTALHFAADRGCLATAQQLLGAGAQVNVQDDDGQTPLHYAALCGNKQVALLLKEDAHADVHIVDNSGQTARCYAPSDWAHMIEQ